MPTVNGFPDTSTIGGAIWSLRYEWIFIVTLPVVAVLHRPRTFAAVLLIASLFWMLSQRGMQFSGFVFGMACAYLMDMPRLAEIVRVRLSLVGTLALIGAFLLPPPINEGFLRTILLFVFFATVVSGNSLFGIFLLRGSKYLGVISYSIYLLHGVILYWAFRAFRSMGVADTPIDFWLTVALAGLVTIVASGVTFLRVERPFIR
jgi:peptidoglycan/LPS O-acetylase OafA/YrhL